MPTYKIDDDVSGRLKNILRPENIKIAVPANLEVKLQEVTDILEHVGLIFHKRLNKRKLFSKWVERLYTLGYNNNILMILKGFWSCFGDIERTFDSQYKSGGNLDPTRYLYPQSAKKTAAGILLPKRQKNSAGNLIFSLTNLEKN